MILAVAGLFTCTAFAQGNGNPTPAKSTTEQAAPKKEKQSKHKGKKHHDKHHEQAAPTK